MKIMSNDIIDQTTYDFWVKELENYESILIAEDIKKVLRCGRDSVNKLMKDPNFPSFNAGGNKITKPNLIKYLCEKRA